MSKKAILGWISAILFSGGILYYILSDFVTKELTAMAYHEQWGGYPHWYVAMHTPTWVDYVLRLITLIFFGIIVIYIYFYGPAFVEEKDV